MQESENDILKRVRKIEIKTRGLSNEIFAGKYHTAFRGRGMSFSEVREYRAGDDVRDIDWNVTARSRKPHIKVYELHSKQKVAFYICGIYDIYNSIRFLIQNKISCNNFLAAVR